MRSFALLEELGPTPPLKAPVAKDPPPPTLNPPGAFELPEPDLVRSNRSEITEKGSRHIRPSLNRKAK